MIDTRQQTGLLPNPGESFERFTIRAHKQLESQVRDPMRRNEIIRRYWTRARGATAPERLARQRFAPDKYDVVHDVCVFAEHETETEDGERRRYDARALAGIVRNCNERIVDVDAFPAISDGHTSDEEGNPDPSVLGYAGNFRLGMIGRKNPRWAIFCDEYRLKGAAPVLSAKPRRSVELWTYKDTGRAHFDPIAALGAEAPRLPLPVRFSTVRKGDATLERYSAAAAPGAMASFGGAQPAGGNTFVKKSLSGGGRRKKQPAKYQQENCSMLAHEDKAEIIDALSSLPQFQFLDRLMNSPAGQKLMDPGLEGADAAEAEKMAAEEAADEELDPMAAPEGDDTGGDPLGAPEDPSMGGEGGELAEPEGDMDDLDDLLGAEDEGEEEEVPQKFQQRYAARFNRALRAEREKYSKLASSTKKLAQQHARLHGQVEQMRRETSDAKREATIDHLAGNYPHFFTDDLVSEEKQKTLYSLGANMSDEQFTKHVASLEKYAQRSPATTPMLPVGEVRKPISDRDRYAAEASQLAVKIHTAAIDSGKGPLDWDNALEEAYKQIEAKRR